MAPRAFGALFALVAAMLLLASLGAGVAPKVIPGWWDGHPRVDGKTIERKEIHVGLLAGHGCNLGETVTCQPLPTGTLLEPIGIAELALIAVTLATLVALMLSAWAIGDRRKWLGKLVLGEAVVIAIVGGVLLVVGPQIKSTQQVAVPIGLGMMMFWAGVGCASIASVIAMRLEREPLRLRPSVPAVRPPPPAPAPPPPPPEPVPTFDFNELVREDQMRAPVPSPGGHLAGPAGPLMPMGLAPPPLSPLQMLPPLPSAPPPMPLMQAPFEHAPQLRPLYDPHNAGVVPVPTQVQLPTQPPEPVSRESFNAMVGISPPDGPARPSSPSVPPPAGPVRTKAASLPPPLAPMMPNRGSRPTGAPLSKHPTIAHAVPPPPGSASLIPASVLSAMHGEPVTAVEIDAEAKARSLGLPGMPPEVEPRASTDVDESAEGDPMAPTAARDSANTIARERLSARELDTAPAPRDSAATIAHARVSAPAIDPSPRDSAATLAHSRMSAPVIDYTAPPFGGAAGREQVPADDPPPVPTSPVLAPARPRVPAPAPRDSAATVARPRVSAPVIDPPQDLNETIEHAAPPPPEPPPKAEPEPEPAIRASQVPISTAPASLPPPRTTEAVAGPTPACPQCEAPMAWVEEHLRFYCPQCRMYF